MFRRGQLKRSVPIRKRKAHNSLLSITRMYHEKPPIGNIERDPGSTPLEKTATSGRRAAGRIEEFDALLPQMPDLTPPLRILC